MNRFDPPAPVCPTPAGASRIGSCTARRLPSGRFGISARDVFVVVLAVLGSIDVRAAAPPRTPGAFEPSLAGVEDGFAIAWYEYTPGAAAEIYLQHMDDQRSPRSPRFKLTSGKADAFEADLVVRERTAFVAWYEKQPKSGASSAQLGAWDLRGRRLWKRALSRRGMQGRNPVVRIHGGSVFAAWIELHRGGSQRIVARWFDLTGRKRSHLIVIGEASPTTWNLNAAIDERGVAWVVYDADIGVHRSELFLARVDARAAQLARISDDDGFASKYPDVRLSDRRLALTWFDERDGNQEVYLAVAEAAVSGDLTRDARRVTDTPGSSFGAYLAWNGDMLGLAWCDDTPGRSAIYFQQFTADGVPLDEAQRLTESAAHAGVPAIQAWRDGFALTWTQTRSTNATDDSEDESRLMLHLIER